MPKAAPQPPRPINLPGLVTFECVARHGSFTRAAAELAVTPTAVSKTIRQLEAQIDARLFNRTTRSVALTEGGTQLMATLSPALEQIRGGIQAVGDSSGRATGTLRINTSYVAYASLIEPHLDELLRRHPGLRFEFAVDNNLSDIVGSGFDAGIRLGHAVHRDMIGVPVGPLQQLVAVASPAYLRRHGNPASPQELLTHDCIRQRLNRARLLEWEFRSGSRSVVIDVQGRLVFDEMRSVLAAALRGCGIAYVFRHFAAAELTSGRLQVLLEKHSPPGETFHLYYPNRAQSPAKLRAFVEFLRAVNWKVPK